MSTLATDSSVFVRRQLHAVTIEILQLLNDENFDVLFKKVVLPNEQYLYSLMLKIKTTGDFALFDKIFRKCITADGEGDISKIISNSKYARILPLFVDFVFRTNKKSIVLTLDFFDVCFKNLDHGKNSNLFLQLYLLNIASVDFAFFIENLKKSENMKNSSIILDAFVSQLDRLSSVDTEMLIDFIKQNFRKFKTSKEQNMVVTLLQKCKTKSSFDTLFLCLADNDCSKVRFRTITAINHLISATILPDTQQIEQIYNAYFGADWEVKDSVLDFIFHTCTTINPEALAKFCSILDKSLTDEMGLVRANAIRVKTELFLKKKLDDYNWETFLQYIVNFVSADLDFNVRRGGVPCLQRIIFEPFDQFDEYFKNNSIFDGLDYDEIKPVLNYERRKVDKLGDLFTYLSCDDDWEVKINVIKLIFDIIISLKRIVEYVPYHIFYYVMNWSFQ